MQAPLTQQRSANWNAEILTAAAIAIAIVGSFLGSGALGGTPVQDASGGYLSADSTLLSPSGPAFSIWSVIYLGLAVYAVFQLLPAGRRSPTAARLRLPAALSAVLNAGWIGVVQLGLLGLSVVVIFALLISLIWMLALLVEHGSATRTEHWIMWLTFGIYLGWVCVASIANMSAWLLSLGVGKEAAWPPGLAMGLLVVAVAIGLGVTAFTRGRMYTALAMVWGIGWIGHSRLTGTNISQSVGYAALACAAILLLGAGALAWRNRTLKVEL